MQLFCLVSQLSSLSIEDKGDTQFPYAMRDLPPMSPGGQAPLSYEAERTVTFTSLPRTHPLSHPIPCLPAGSLTIPQRPNCAGADAEFQPLPLRRQLVSHVSLDSPLSPSSRPRSPWGRFDPYDSPEVCFCAFVTFISGVCV